MTARRRWLAWLPAGSYMLLIWVLSSIPQTLAVDDFPFRDKGIHFVEYGVLAALLAHAAYGTWPHWRIRSTLLVAWIASAFWGLLDEIHQAYVPGRVADARDWVADVVGGLIGAALYLAVRRRLRPARRSP